MLRRLNAWILKWAETPYGIWAIFLLAFTEAFFFPVPPDILLIVLGFVKPNKIFTYALCCYLGSMLGGCFGYFIGQQYMLFVGDSIINFYGFTNEIDYIKMLYDDYGFFAVIIAGLTFIPYKLCTITAGMFQLDFFLFFLASAISRFIRFYIIALIIYFFGVNMLRNMKNFLEILIFVVSLFLILVLLFFI